MEKYNLKLPFERAMISDIEGIEYRLNNPALIRNHFNPSVIENMEDLFIDHINQYSRVAILHYTRGIIHNLRIIDSEETIADIKRNWAKIKPIGLYVIPLSEAIKYANPALKAEDISAWIGECVICPRCDSVFPRQDKVFQECLSCSAEFE